MSCAARVTLLNIWGGLGRRRDTQPRSTYVRTTVRHHDELVVPTHGSVTADAWGTSSYELAGAGALKIAR